VSVIRVRVDVIHDRIRHACRFGLGGSPGHNMDTGRSVALDDLMARAVEAGIMMAAGYIAGCKDKSDAWGKKHRSPREDIHLFLCLTPGVHPGR
jgi:hypothetical protein